MMKTRNIFIGIIIKTQFAFDLETKTAVVIKVKSIISG